MTALSAGFPSFYFRDVLHLPISSHGIDKCLALVASQHFHYILQRVCLSCANFTFLWIVALDHGAA
jgi:hypothetical protein